MSRKRQLAYLVLGVNTIVWGLAAAIVKPALSFTTPERFLFYRFLLASLVILPILPVVLRKIKLSWTLVGKIVGLELLGTTLLLWLIYTALNLTTALESSFIYSTSPIFVTLAGVFILKERETKREWRGLVIALAGTLVITVAPDVTSGAKAAGSLMGNGLMVLQNILWALYLVAAKRVYRHIPKLAVTSISFILGAVSFYLLSLPGGNPLLLITDELRNPAVAIAVGYMAIFGSIIGATTYLIGQNLIEVSEATVFTYLEALVALPAAVFFLGENLTPAILIGALIVGMGVYITEYRPH